MNINRHNYEEWLMLYADNELSPAEKQQVEQFLQANPDLQEELVLLQQSTLSPETISFDDKESLLKPVAINETQQEQLLLLLDDALTAQQATSLQASIAASETLSTEWQLLQKTKLSADDKIVFPNKPSLYRKEKDRVIPLAWWRVAAAALLIGFGTWGGIRLLNNNHRSIEGSTAVTGKPAATSSATATTKLPIEQPSNGNDNAAPIEPVVQNSLATATDNNTNREVNSNRKAANAPAGRDQILKDDQPTIAINPAPLQTINAMESNNNASSNVPLKSNDQTIAATQVPASQEIDNSYVASQFATESSTVKYASFDEEEEKPKKTKVGAFFKQMKRVIERKANIKTGDDNNIKIANMSFAMH